MTSGEKRFSVIFVAALAIGVLWGTSRKGAPSPNPALGRFLPAFSPPLSSLVGNGTGRRWIGARFAKIGTISDFGRVAWEGSLLAVLSARDHRLREYSLAGRLVGAPGGRGSPPDANGGLPTDFAVGPAGRLWFADANAPAGDGTVQVAREARGLAVRAMGLAASRNVIFLLLPPSSRQMFAAISPPSGAELRFGRLLVGQSADGVETFGDIAAAPRLDRLFYAATYVGIIGGWSAGGRRIFLRRTVAPLPPAEVVRVPRGSRIAFHAPYSCLDLCYSAARLYVLTDVPPGAKLPVAVLDAYSAANGDYLGSIRLPRRCRQFALRGDLLATSSIHGTMIWRVALQ